MLNILSAFIILLFASQVQAGSKSKGKSARIDLTVRPDIAARLRASGLDKFLVKVNCDGSYDHTYQSQSSLVPVQESVSLETAGCDTDPALRPQANKFSNWELYIYGQNGKSFLCGQYGGNGRRDNNIRVTYELNGCASFDIPMLPSAIPVLEKPKYVIPIPAQIAVPVVLPGVVLPTKGDYPIVQTTVIPPAIVPVIIPTQKSPPVIIPTHKIAPVFIPTQQMSPPILPAMIPVIAKPVSLKPVGKGPYQSAAQNGFIPSSQYGHEGGIMKLAIGKPLQHQALPVMLGKSGYPPVQSFATEEASDDLI